MTNTNLPIALALSAFALATPITAFANETCDTGGSENCDAFAEVEASLTLIDAVQSLDEAVQDDVTEAYLDELGDAPVYVIATETDTSSMEFIVDGMSGEVLAEMGIRAASAEVLELISEEAEQEMTDSLLMGLEAGDEVPLEILEALLNDEDVPPSESDFMVDDEELNAMMDLEAEGELDD